MEISGHTVKHFCTYVLGFYQQKKPDVLCRLLEIEMERIIFNLYVIWYGKVHLNHFQPYIIIYICYLYMLVYRDIAFYT